MAKKAKEWPPKKGIVKLNPANNGSQNGPLRDIERILLLHNKMFPKDRVRFTCGHRGYATPGAKQGRCGECKPRSVST